MRQLCKAKVVFCWQEHNCRLLQVNTIDVLEVGSVGGKKKDVTMYGLIGVQLAGAQWWAVGGQ